MNKNDIFRKAVLESPMLRKFNPDIQGMITQLYTNIHSEDINFGVYGYLERHGTFLPKHIFNGVLYLYLDNQRRKCNVSGGVFLLDSILLRFLRDVCGNSTESEQIDALSFFNFTENMMLLSADSVFTETSEDYIDEVAYFLIVLNTKSHPDRDSPFNLTPLCIRQEVRKVGCKITRVELNIESYINALAPGLEHVSGLNFLSHISRSLAKSPGLDLNVVLPHNGSMSERCKEQYLPRGSINPLSGLPLDKNLSLPNMFTAEAIRGLITEFQSATIASLNLQ